MTKNPLHVYYLARNKAAWCISDLGDLPAETQALPAYQAVRAHYVAAATAARAAALPALEAIKAANPQRF